MKKLIIICEGQTEELFCSGILKPHLATKDIAVEHPLILHSNGGIVPWRHIKKQIELHHASDERAFITTFIDYYGLLPTYKYPNWAQAHAAATKPNTVNILEAGMKGDLAPVLAALFIPYIQLHEFEALVLSDADAFATHYEAREYDVPKLTALCAAAPETVNDGSMTAPSKRLMDIISGYDKVNDGFELTKLAGLKVIRARCPRFDNWITTLEGI